VVIPTLTSFEKSGSFINRNFRLQSFKQAVPGPAGLLPDLHVYASLANALSESSQTPDLAQVWTQMSKSPTNPLHGISYAKIPSDGLQLDGSKWDSLSFVEKKALNYSPSKHLKEA
jgi:NADH-quinone oxidoreductase subunit G